MASIIPYDDTNTTVGAKTLVDNYLNYAGNQHIDINGEYYYGHVFTQGELRTLLGDVINQKGITVILALEDRAPGNTIRLVLGSTSNTNVVDRSNLLISEPAPYQGDIGMFRGIAQIAKGYAMLSLNSESVQGMINGLFASVKSLDDKGDPMVPSKFYESFAMHINFEEEHPLLVGSPSEEDKKVLAYNIPHLDLFNLNIWSDSGSSSDRFIFVPLVIDEDVLGVPLSKPHLTFALFRMDQNANIVGSIQEYFRPCPDYCHNYLDFIA